MVNVISRSITDIASDLRHRSLYVNLERQAPVHEIKQHIPQLENSEFRLRVTKSSFKGKGTRRHATRDLRAIYSESSESRAQQLARSPLQLPLIGLITTHDYAGELKDYFPASPGATVCTPDFLMVAKQKWLPPVARITDPCNGLRAVAETAKSLTWL